MNNGGIMVKNTWLFFIIALLFGCGTNEKADLVILNGKIITMDDQNPTSSALAVKNGKILDIGSNEQIKKLIGNNTEVISLNGELVTPGLIESHAHFWGIGQLKRTLDLSETKNWDEIVYLVSEKVKKSNKNEWIIGRGWHQEKWNKKTDDLVEGFPVNLLLNEVAPDNPLILKHASGHAVIANKKALELAGINYKTVSPSGGKIIKNSKGEVTGVLTENAGSYILAVYDSVMSRRTPEEKEREIKEEYLLANMECISKGITSFHDAGSSFSQVNSVKKLIDEGKTGVRLYLMLEEQNPILKKEINKYRLIGYGNNFLTVRAVKKYMDGALGSRSALFFDKYEDDKNTSGLQVTSDAELDETAKIVFENGFQLCVHSIGDLANNKVINLYEKYYNLSENKDLRWRIEHAQHLIPADIPRFNKIGIIAAMQPVHCTSDAIFVENRIGKERAKTGAYMWKVLLEHNTIISGGTDSPVEKVDPIANYYSAVTRKYSEDKTFYEDQKLSRIDALKIYTINGAKASFEEKLKGSLTKGKLADITIFTKDITTIQEEEIKATEVLYTIIDGKICYRRNK